jgi:acyl-coenzyme A thioesterase PaaI-like protein
MKDLTRFKLFLQQFGRFEVPMIGYLKPEIIELSDKSIVIKIKLNRRSKNHLNSMYFGALAVGADVAGGLLAFYHADRAQVKLSLAFKSFEAQFLRRPESDVYFTCEMGDRIKEMLIESHQTQQRVNKPIEVNAYVKEEENMVLIAHFKLELSLKLI